LQKAELDTSLNLQKEIQEVWRQILEVFEPLVLQALSAVDVEFPETYLRPGKIEQLVKEGRYPINLGSPDSAEGSQTTWIQIPPRGYSHEDVILDDTSSWYCLFRNKRRRGKPLTGTIFQVSLSESESVDKRIAAESTRIDLQQIKEKHRI